MSALTALPRYRSCLAFAVVLLCLGSRATAQEAEGLRVIVPNPITSEAVTRLDATIQQAINRPQKPVKKIVFDFNPDNKEVATRNFGECYTLADKIRNLSINGITTIAWVHNKVSAHTVLPVLACTELVMSPDAKIGEIVSASAPTPPERELNFYADLAGPGREAIVLKMADKNVEVVKGLRNQSAVYLDSRKRDQAAYRDVVGIDPVPVLTAGAVELYTAEQARAFGLARSIRANLGEVAEAYQLSIAALKGDLLQGREPSAWKIDVRGQVDRALREAIKRRFRYVVARGANVIFLQIECGGGDLTAAREMADDIRDLKDKDGNPILTVAFIPEKAPDTAAFIALGCTEIVMTKGNAERQEAMSELGDFVALLEQPVALPGPLNKMNKKNGPPPPPPGERLSPEIIRKNLRELAEARSLPTVILEGLVDKDLVIIRARGAKDATRYRFMKEAEFEQENRVEKVWIDAGKIKDKGQYLKLTAALAKEVGIARYLIDNRDIKEVYPLYGLEPTKVQESSPDWLDGLAEFLRRPEVSVLLIIIGVACLILELKVPGIAVAGIISAICFVLFFWAQSQMSGQISLLAILLFLLGIALIMVEIFILPGFGVTGISGIVLVVVGLGLATVDHVPQTGEEWVDFSATLLQYGLSIVVAGIVAMVVARYLPNIPYANRLMLAPPTDELEGGTNQLPGADEAAALLGQMGVAETVLRPAGMAKFGEKYVDVVTDGGFISAGSRIQVIEVEGSRIVVKQV